MQPRKDGICHRCNSPGTAMDGHCAVHTATPACPFHGPTCRTLYETPQKGWEAGRKDHWRVHWLCGAVGPWSSTATGALRVAVGQPETVHDQRLMCDE